MAFIPYGSYWSTPFAKWQGKLSHLHSIELAAHVTKKALAERSIDPTQIDYCAYGLTVIQDRSFFATPWFSGEIGAGHIGGPTITQACATGPRLLSSALGDMQVTGATCALIASGDKTSNGPHVYYPAPAGMGGTGKSEDWVVDNFNFDPWAKGAMIQTGENTAKRFGIETAEQHDVVLRRLEQYQMALADDRAFQKRYMDEKFEVPDAKFRKTIDVLEGDEGVYPTTKEKLDALKPVLPEGTITFAGQTHPADGCAGMMVVDTVEHAKEMAGSDQPVVEILAVAQSREDPGFMPAAPIGATRKVLDKADISIGDVTAIKSHNPFAVNDIAFSRHFNVDWQSMNNYGSSLIWGHPQGPTGIRGMIELIEELEVNGGGIGLFQGCAAGDSAMAVLLKLH